MSHLITLGLFASVTAAILILFYYPMVVVAGLIGAAYWIINSVVRDHLNGEIDEN